MKFHISETDEVLISHSGLVLAGALLQRTTLKKRIDRVKLGGGKPEISHGDNVLSMIGLLCMGKSDFERSTPSILSRTSSFVWPLGWIVCRRSRRCDNAWTRWQHARLGYPRIPQIVCGRLFWKNRQRWSDGTRRP